MQKMSLSSVLSALPVLLSAWCLSGCGHEPNPGTGWYVTEDIPAHSFLKISQFAKKEYADLPADFALVPPIELMTKEPMKKGHTICVHDFDLGRISYTDHREQLNALNERVRAGKKWPEDFGDSETSLTKTDPGFREMKIAASLYLRDDTRGSIKHYVAALNDIAARGLNEDKYLALDSNYYLFDVRMDLSHSQILQHDKAATGSLLDLAHAKLKADKKVNGELSDSVVGDLDDIADIYRQQKDWRKALSSYNSALAAANTCKTIAQETKIRMQKDRAEVAAKLRSN